MACKILEEDIVDNIKIKYDLDNFKLEKRTIFAENNKQVVIYYLKDIDVRKICMVGHIIEKMQDINGLHHKIEYAVRETLDLENKEIWQKKNKDPEEFKKWIGIVIKPE